MGFSRVNPSSTEFLFLFSQIAEYQRTWRTASRFRGLGEIISIVLVTSKILTCFGRQHECTYHCSQSLLIPE